MLQFLALLGFPIGKIINKYTKEEIQKGERFFKRGYKIILITTAVLLLFQQPHILPFFLGIIAGFLIKEEFLYLGLIPINLPIICMTTITAMIATTQKNKLFLPILLFICAMGINLLFHINAAAFIAGALITRSFK